MPQTITFTHHASGTIIQDSAKDTNLCIQGDVSIHNAGETIVINYNRGSFDCAHESILSIDGNPPTAFDSQSNRLLFFKQLLTTLAPC